MEFIDITGYLILLISFFVFPFSFALPFFYKKLYFVPEITKVLRFLCDVYEKFFFGDV